MVADKYRAAADLSDADSQVDPVADVIIIGAGMAGASLAWALAPRLRVLLLEREDQPGYHATGRSAALFMPGYGNRQVRALTRASEAFYRHPPPGFADHPLLAPRGALMVASHGQAERLDAHAEMLWATEPRAQRLDAAECVAHCPVLRGERLLGGVWEPADDLDVHAIHQGFLRGMRRSGGRLVCEANVQALAREGGVWQVRTASRGDSRTWRAPRVVNAAGAWADQIGALAGARAIGLQPLRRSALVFAGPDDQAFGHWPLVHGAAEDWYFKPDAGRLLGSPANADPVPPHDVQAEEIDIALAIHRISEITTLNIRRPQRTWAGLRSFVADGGLVGGYDAQARGFFWLAGQGGYGIQTAPAMAQACAALLLDEPLPAPLRAQGLSAEELAPLRLHAVDHHF